MDADYCRYPPQIADRAEIIEHRDGGRPAFILGSTMTGRFVLLHSAEHEVFQLLRRSLTPAAICAKFKQEHGRVLSLAVLTKFLSRLDDIGLLDGWRSQVLADQPFGTEFYRRFSLFDPDRLFARMVSRLRWIWTPGFVLFSLFLVAFALLLSLMNWGEVSSYAMYALRRHYVAIFIAGILVGFSHEFAHGLTCKAFGGPVREIGVLMIYYFLPALYCNVSGVHFIRQRSRRLWVIAAGVYWQVLVGAVAILVWFTLAPFTLPADLAFAFFLGSVADVAFNANPLIKLDGYYFLSQCLRIPNLMDRSRSWWRSALRRLFLAETESSSPKFSLREHSALAAFGAVSFIYTTGLKVFIVCYVGSYLIDWFQFAGLLLAAGLGIFYARQSVALLISTAAPGVSRFLRRLFKRLENVMSQNEENPSAVRNVWRRRLPALGAVLAVVVVSILPWGASVGSYGTLVAIAGQETIIRAPESATLVEVQALPGASLASGSVLGRMRSIDLEEQLMQVEAELARVQSDHDRLMGELRVDGAAVAHADLNLRQRTRDFAEIDAEQRQISYRRASEAPAGMRLLATLHSSLAIPEPGPRPNLSLASYPPAIAVLEADMNLRDSKLREANAELDRARRLHAEGLIAGRDLDTAETRASTAAMELAGAREHLEAALIEHGRKLTGLSTEVEMARSKAGTARLEIEKLTSELSATRALLGALEHRHRLLEARRAQFVLTAPRTGTVFGEDLPRMVGQFFPKGAEICRIVNTRQLLLRIQVPERLIGDVRAGDPVRLRTRSFPGQVFRGVVSTIGGQSEPDQYEQATYRVELVIDNLDGLLRPGMTAFARIDFGRQMIGRILAHKLWQVLRPELWLL
jgi:multidrug resistance efflux pump